MTHAALAHCLLTRPEIPQGRKDDSTEWADHDHNLPIRQMSPKQLRHRRENCRRWRAAKRAAAGKAKTLNGWQQAARKHWKRQEGK